MSDNLQDLRDELEAAEAAELAEPLPCSGAQAAERSRRVVMARVAYARALGTKANKDGEPRSANPYTPAQALGAWCPHAAWDGAWRVADTVTIFLTKQQIFATIANAWKQRATVLALPKKGARRDADREAFVQGALMAFLATGCIDRSDYQQVAFLCSIGRLEEEMERWGDSKG